MSHSGVIAFHRFNLIQETVFYTKQLLAEDHPGVGDDGNRTWWFQPAWRGSRKRAGIAETQQTKDTGSAKRRERCFTSHPNSAPGQSCVFPQLEQAQLKLFVSVSHGTYGSAPRKLRVAQLWRWMHSFLSGGPPTARNLHALWVFMRLPGFPVTPDFQMATPREQQRMLGVFMS